MSASTAEPPRLVRSIFYYNTEPSLGQSVSLHFFEPRYRVLAARALTEQRQRQFVFLPNFTNYQASHGDIGFITTIVQCRPVPVANANELPRADVQIRFDARALVLFHWIESNTGGLTECICTPIPLDVPRPDLAWPAVRAAFDSVAKLEAALEIGSKNPGAKLVSASHNQDSGDGEHHLLLHAPAGHAQAEAMIANAGVPAVKGAIYPVGVARMEETISMAAHLQRAAALCVRLAPSAPSPAVTAALPTPAASASSAADGDGDGGAATDATADAAMMTTSAAAAGVSPISRSSSPESLGQLSVRQLRAHLDRLQVAIPPSAIEKSDLVSLLAAATAKERHAMAAARAAEIVESCAVGLPIAMACGCPTPTVEVFECSFARQSDGVRIAPNRPDAMWGHQHDFIVDDSTAVNVGVMSNSVYEWERRSLSFGLRPPGQPHEPPYNQLPRIADADVPRLLCHACLLTLTTPSDDFARIHLTPNLVRTWAVHSNAQLRRLCRWLSWPRVRLLLIGHRELDADLLDLIAEWLVVVEMQAAFEALLPGATDPSYAPN